jgi:hypothetical protein
MLVISAKTAWHSWHSLPALAGKRRAQCEALTAIAAKVFLSLQRYS